MGLLRHGDTLSSKYTTAMVTDGDQLYMYPIKQVLGDFFVININRQTFCFKLVPSREKTYRPKGVRSCKVLFYDTSHVMPINAANNKELEIILRDNALPRVDGMLLATLRHLGKKESHDPKKFKPHDLQQLFDAVAQEQTEYKEQAENILTFFKNLNVNQIVTPVKNIAEFLTDDLYTSFPQFFGSVVEQCERVDHLHKRVTNQPITGKGPWLKIILILCMVGLGAGVLIWAVSSGAFSHLLPTLPGSIGPTLPGSTGNAKLTMAQIGTSYPTPKSLVDALHAQQVSCSQLPSEAVKMVNDPSGGGAVGTCP